MTYRVWLVALTTGALILLICSPLMFNLVRCLRMHVRRKHVLRIAKTTAVGYGNLAHLEEMVYGNVIVDWRPRAKRG